MGEGDPAIGSLPPDSNDVARSDAAWMALALEQAETARAAGEVAVGAVLVRDGRLIATGRNAPLARCDPTAHAEIEALRSGAAAIGNYRLDGCTLYVTLEPCAMCAGAMLHARLARVVFGASDFKTGAAGSVLDLFALSALNHRTRVEGGVLADACAGLLQSFFRDRRDASRRAARPLRDDALRTPEGRFAEWPQWAEDGAQVADLPSLDGWRLHYRDLGLPTAARTLVALHGWGDWSLWFQPLADALLGGSEGMRPGWRLLLPDLIGHGRSDKPKREQVHTMAWHAKVLCEWMDRLRLPPVLLVAAPDALALAAAVSATAGQRVIGTVECPASAEREDSEPSLARWRAPYPDPGHQAAWRAFGRPRPATRPTPPQMQRLLEEAMGYFPP